MRIQRLSILILTPLAAWAIGCSNATVTAPDATASQSAPGPAAVVSTDANSVLASAIAKAKSDERALFVHFSADW